MAANIGFGVSLRSYAFEDSLFTFNLHSGIVAADVGKAVTLDTAAANTVKLAGDGDTIIGRLEVVENRTQEGVLIGTVALRFADLLPIKSGLTSYDVVAVGSTAVGSSTTGSIKAKNSGSAATPDLTENYVAELVTINSVAYAVVVKV